MTTQMLIDRAIAAGFYIILIGGALLLILWLLFSRKKKARVRYIRGGNTQEGVARNFLTMPNPQMQNAVSRNATGIPVRSSSVNDYIGYFVLLDEQDKTIRLRGSKKLNEGGSVLLDNNLYEITYRAGKLLSALPIKE
ncbi:MAG: hypothetical protein J6P72_08350 [Firmicutes bacterium]|nr:hypothetical protein [Bacillota bacterium]